MKNLDLDESSTESIRKKLSKVFAALLFCLNELGVWLAMKVFLNSCFGFVHFVTVDITKVCVYNRLHGFCHAMRLTFLHGGMGICLARKL